MHVCDVRRAVVSTSTAGLFVLISPGREEAARGPVRAAAGAAAGAAAEAEAGGVGLTAKTFRGVPFSLPALVYCNTLCADTPGAMLKWSVATKKTKKTLPKRT